jgi:hypothetical protein
MGIGGLIAGVIAAVVVVAMHLSREWRLLLFVPFAISAYGFLQAREKTCVLLAAVGKREVNDGSYADVADEERAILRRRALVIAVRSILIATLITAAIDWIIGTWH